MQIPKPGLIHRLQNLDEGHKQKIMVVATIIIMIVVIWLWAAYFNSIVAGAH
jgi:hypothetical protein